VQIRWPDAARLLSRAAVGRRGRQPQGAAAETIQRLRTRKQQVHQDLAARGGGRRTALAVPRQPAAAAPPGAERDRPTQPAAPAGPTPAPPENSPPEESSMERLFKAKQQVWRERRPPGGPRPPDRQDPEERPSP